jgi:hypothetical protein
MTRLIVTSHAEDQHGGPQRPVRLLEAGARGG